MAALPRGVGGLSGPGTHQLAQLNAGVLRFAAGDPRLAGFDAVVDRVNRLAETSPGFVWRHPESHRQRHRSDVTDGAAATTVVNLSTWAGYADLHRFVYRSAHGALVRRRGEWFVPVAGPLTVLWWVRVDTRPTAEDGLARLSYLRRHGPTARAFTVRRRFDPEGRPERR